MSAIKTFIGLAALAAVFPRAAADEYQLTVQITGYGTASNDPAGSSTICCGEEGSEHSATFDDPGVVATDPDVYPTGTKFYVPGLQKYFIAKDYCQQCVDDHGSGKEHIDLWVGPTDFQDYDDLLACAIHDGADSAVVLVNPKDGYTVDPTPLMDSNGVCDGNVDYSRPVPTGGEDGSDSGDDTTTCEWAGHCAGATCSTDNDCSDVLTCQNGVCGGSS